jgi:hypothetical protein
MASSACCGITTDQSCVVSGTSDLYHLHKEKCPLTKTEQEVRKNEIHSINTLLYTD